MVIRSLDLVCPRVTMCEYYRFCVNVVMLVTHEKKNYCFYFYPVMRDSFFFKQVKELENAVVELMDTYNNSMHFSSAIQSVGDKYQPGQEVLEFSFSTLFIIEWLLWFVHWLSIFSSFLHFHSNLFVGLMFEIQLTDFKKLIEDEIATLKTNSSSVTQNNPLIRQFKEAVWVWHCNFQFNTIRNWNLTK